LATLISVYIHVTSRVVDVCR